ncbi:MAG: hypothetical protein K2W82_10710 [Candidatus Obscuribacterales bacterium]|nr:hypothetical protein [Candidatus Obscuribacterales bacterium]
MWFKPGWLCTFVLFGVATFFALRTPGSLVPNPQPYTTYRWYDGTREKFDYVSPYSDKEVERTVYGEDGMTVLRHERINKYGNPLYVMVRLKNGHLDIKEYESPGTDGKTVLVSHEIQTADSKTPLLVRRYYTDGTLASEMIRPDEKVPTRFTNKEFTKEGVLVKEFVFDHNGDVAERQYDAKTGKLSSFEFSKTAGTGDIERHAYFEDGVTVRAHSLKKAGANILTVQEYYRSGNIRTERVCQLLGRFSNGSNAEQIISNKVYYADGKSLFSSFVAGDEVDVATYLNQDGSKIFVLKLFAKDKTSFYEHYQNGKLAYVQKYKPARVSPGIAPDWLDSVRVYSDEEHSVFYEFVDVDFFSNRLGSVSYFDGDKLTKKQEIAKDGKTVLKEELYSEGKVSKTVVYAEAEGPQAELKDAHFADTKLPQPPKVD